MLKNLIKNFSQKRLSTSRRDLMAAFKRVISLSGQRRVTDLHVRTLLNYVRANDRYYTGVARSLKRLARKLLLSVSTCRRVIARAVEEFGLLIVIPQRHNPGGQTVNRYTINWDQVDAILRDAVNKLYSELTSSNPVSTDAPVPSCSLKDYSLQPNSRLAPSAVKSIPIAFPRNTPSDLLSHFDTLLTKLQAAIDRAKQLGATKIHDRLMTLWYKLGAVHYRASHAALCRTNLPPLNPPPERSLDVDPWSGFDFDAFNARVAATYAAMRARLSQPCYGLTAPALSDHPPARGDHPPLDQSPNSAIDYDLEPTSPVRLGPDSPVRLAPNSPVRLAPNSPVRLAPSAVEPSGNPASDLESLLNALDELIASFSAALDCAKHHAITWLENRFTTFRARVKAILTRAQIQVLPSTPTWPSASGGPTHSPVVLRLCKCGLDRLE